MNMEPSDLTKRIMKQHEQKTIVHTGDVSINVDHEIPIGIQQLNILKEILKEQKEIVHQLTLLNDGLE